MSTDSSVCGTKSLLIYWLKDDIVEWWHRVWHSKQYMIVWLQNRLTCDCSTHAPAFTGHVLNSSPPCSLATWFFGLFFHLAQSFFSEKIPWQGGAGWLQRGAASPPFPRPGSESSLKPPGNVTFLSLLSLSSGRSLLLHALNPSFTFIGPSILEESVTFLSFFSLFCPPAPQFFPHVWIWKEK